MTEAEGFKIASMSEEERARYLRQEYPPSTDEQRVMDHVLMRIRNSVDRFPRALIITAKDGNCGYWHVEHIDHGQPHY